MTSMKALLPLSAAVSLLALIAFPTSATAGSVFFALSLVTIFAADYNRVIKPLTPSGRVVAFTKPAPVEQVCEQAA